MSIFDAQFGGVPLINTYQFNQGPGLPDISGYRGLLQGSAMQRATTQTAARATTASGDDLEGLPGQVRTYRAAESALEAQRNAAMSGMYDKFMNKYNGIWENFYAAEAENLSRLSLEFQEADAAMEAERVRFKNDLQLMGEVEKNKSIKDNLAIIQGQDGFLGYGRLTEGRGEGWAPIHELEEVYHGNRALGRLGQNIAIGQELILPSEYNVNAFSEDLDAALTHTVASLVRTAYGGTSPRDINDVFSEMITKEGHTEHNKNAVMNVVNNAMAHLSPEGQRALLAQTLQARGRYRLNEKHPEREGVGIPNYIITTTRGRRGEPIIQIDVERDSNGDMVLFDLNDPAELQRAMESQARIVAAERADTRFRFDTRHSESVAFGRERPIPDAGPHVLAWEGALPTQPTRRVVTLGFGRHSINQDLNLWRERIGHINHSLQGNFARVLESFKEKNPALAEQLHRTDLTQEQKKEINRRLYLEMQSAGLSKTEIGQMFGAFANQPATHAETGVRRIASGAVRALPFTDRTLPADDNAYTVPTGTIRDAEWGAMFAENVTVNVHEDLQENVDRFNISNQFTHSGLINVGGLTQTFLGTELGTNGIVFVANRNIHTRRPMQTNAQGDTKDVVGREGLAIIRSSLINNTETVATNRRGDVRRMRWRQFRPFRRDGNVVEVVLNSEDFDKMFPTPQHANEARSALRRADGKLELTDKVTFVPAVIGIENVLDEDRPLIHQSVNQLDDDIAATQNFEQRRAIGDFNQLGGALIEIHPTGSAPTAAPAVNRNPAPAQSGRIGQSVVLQ